MPRTLLVTNDFPPTIGGIQSYLRDFVETLPADEIVVFASTQDAAAAARFDATADYRVVRWSRSVMLPTTATVEAMAATVAEFDIDTVWFGSSAPLGLMAPAARAAGARRVVASTHGHEVGWSMLPGGRAALRRIGDNVDAVTYISDYTAKRLRPAFGPHPDYVALPSGVDVDYFHPFSPAEREKTRRQWGWGADPVIVCVSRLVRRKGQDQLIRVMPEIRRRHPRARLVIVGDGPDRARLRRLAHPEREAVEFTGAVTRDEVRDLTAAADVAAMPARTRFSGLDVEGLGIVYLEAQAAGVPVVAGSSGGAPETVRDKETGFVVSGRDREELTAAVDTLLGDDGLRAAFGARGREVAVREWAWPLMASRLRAVLSPD